MFDSLISDAQTFLRALSRDNTRDWFVARKPDYDSRLRDPAKALLDEMSPFDKDHPHGDLLRHKGLVATGKPDLSGDLVAQLDVAFSDVWPLSDMPIGVAEARTI